MNDTDFEPLPTPARPRTATVIGLLVATAALFSYLTAYALTGALVKAEVLTYSPQHDHRPIWFLATFFTLLLIFGSVALLLRATSRRQLQQIDAQNND